MTASVNEELISLINEIKSSKYDKDQSVILLGDLVSNIINNNITSDNLWGVGMTINAYTKKVRGGVPKDTYKKDEGFDPIEVNDSGC